MIIIMSSGVTDEHIDGVVKKLKGFGLDSNVSRGIERTVIGAIGDENKIDKELLQALPGVEDVIRVMKPYKIVARSFHKEDTVIDINGIKLGGNQIQIIAGPCSVET
jgi:3-deoxy-7-phosphoheptulonate synthase